MFRDDWSGERGTDGVAFGRDRSHTTPLRLISLLLLSALGAATPLEAAPMLSVNRSNGDIFVNHYGGHYGFSIHVPMPGLVCANYQSMADKYGSAEFGGPWEPCFFGKSDESHPLAFEVIETPVSFWSGGSDHLGAVLAPGLRQIDEPIEFVWFRATSQPGLYEGVLGSVHYFEYSSVTNGGFDGGALTSWQVYLDGDAQAEVISWNAGWVLQMISGSPAVVSQNITTPAAGMKLFFDFNFETPTGTLSVMLDNTVLATLTAADDTQEGMTSYCLEVTDPALLGQESLGLDFYFDGPSASSVLLDNITFMELPEPATLGLLAMGWLGLFKRRG